MTDTGTQSSEAIAYRFGRLQFDPARYELRADGQIVDVQRKPLEVLAVLLARAGEVVTKQELIKHVWHSRPLVDNVVPSTVTRLRLALGPEAGSIVTHHRIGYRFAGRVERFIMQPPDRGMRLSAGDPVPGRGTFRLETLFSRAAGCEVWSARHAKTAERRVYKLCEDYQAAASLQREVTVMRVLRHSLGERADMVRLIDWSFEAAPYSLEYEHFGISLAQWAATPAFAAASVNERLQIFLQIADAVAAAHDAGVLHEDLTPGSVLIDASSRSIKLAGFGSGALIEPQRLSELGITQHGDDIATVPHHMAGTASALYLAPELLVGVAPSRQSDVYALGIMLYQLLCADLRQPIAPGWERNVPDERLREIVRAATDGDPLQRLQSIADLTARLRRPDERRSNRTADNAKPATPRLVGMSRVRMHWLLAATIVGVAAVSMLTWAWQRI